MPIQTIVVEPDRHDPARVMITVREQNGFGHTVRVERAQIPQLILDLNAQCVVNKEEVG